MVAKSYQLDELLRAQPSAHVTADVVRRINQSEAGIREHLLRDVSNGSDPTYRQSRPRSSSILTNPYEELRHPDLERPRTRNHSGRYSKYSPTPSIKRGKAEKLLKEHGSPPGLRVTAGGRIVPNGPSPIMSPRFVSNAPHNKFQPQNRFGRVNPLSVPSDFGMDGMRALNGILIDAGNGVICQLIDGQLRPVGTRDGPLHLYMPAPNLPMQSNIPPYGAFPGQGSCPPFASAATMPLVQRMNPALSGIPAPPAYSSGTIRRELQIMEDVYANLEQELKTLNRNEVLNRDSLTPTAKADIVRQRVDLVNKIDESRRGVLEARRLANQHGPVDVPITQSPNGQVPAMPNFGAFTAIHNQFSTFNTVEPYYNAGPQPVVPAAYNFIPQGPPFVLPAYAPFVPEYGSAGAPQFPGIHGQFAFQANERTDQREAAPPALQERAGNAGMGQGSNATHAARASTDTSKTFYPANLDGSVHQPRRSHAVEIKRPQEGSEQETSRSNLNPASPSYQPNQLRTVDNAAIDDDRSAFIPSPTLVTQMDNLVRSPTLTDRAFDGLGDSHHTSDASATTADFFPMPADAKQHSSAKYSFRGNGDPHVNMAAWFRHGSALGGQAMVHGNGGQSKFDAEGAHNTLDGSSGQMHYDRSKPASTTVRHPSTNVSPAHVNHSCDMDFIIETAFMHISPGTKRQQSAHLRESTATFEESALGARNSGQDPVSELLRQASQQVAGLSPQHGNGAPYGRSKSYYSGFKLGMKREIQPDAGDAEFREGYRDGISHYFKTTFSKEAASTSTNGAIRQRERSTSQLSSLPALPGPWNPPSTKANSVLQYTIPRPPQNSVSSTPVTSRSAKGRSPSAGLTLDSPQAEANFMSQPNINKSSSLTPVHKMPSTGKSKSAGNGGMSATMYRSQGSDSATRDMVEDPPSPLANRQLARSSAMKANQNMSLDQQRFRKAKPSVAQTTAAAHAHMLGQGDASKDITGAVVQQNALASFSPPTSPLNKPRSPVKSAATAAVATIAQLARAGTRKEQDPVGSPSPEKKAWRTKWMGGKKADDQEEYDAFKKKFTGM